MYFLYSCYGVVHLFVFLLFLYQLIDNFVSNQVSYLDESKGNQVKILNYPRSCKFLSITRGECPSVIWNQHAEHTFATG